MAYREAENNRMREEANEARRKRKAEGGTSHWLEEEWMAFDMEVNYERERKHREQQEADDEFLAAIIKEDEQEMEAKKRRVEKETSATTAERAEEETRLKTIDVTLPVMTVKADGAKKEATKKGAKPAEVTLPVITIDDDKEPAQSSTPSDDIFYGAVDVGDPIPKVQAKARASRSRTPAPSRLSRGKTRYTINFGPR